MSHVIEPMTEQDVENFIAESELLAKVAGFSNADEMGGFKCHAAEGMIKFGGGFTHFLGHALARADSKNTAILIRAFRGICDHHADLWKTFIAKRDNGCLGDDEC